MANLGDVLRQVVCTPKHIPDDWAFFKLTDVCSPKQWKTISSVEMTATGYPVFGANGFVGFYPEYNHADETVAITCRGNTCGTINRIPPKTYITGNSMALNDIKSNVVLQEYLYYALKYRGVGDSVSGSAQPQITGAGLRSIEFPAPPLPEQQEIATILSSVDDVIEKTRAQIDKLKDLKTGMMQELLTKGIGHTEFKDSPVGRIPNAWSVMSLGSLLHTKPLYGANAPSKPYKAGLPRYLRITDILDDGQLDPDCVVGVDQDMLGDYYVSKNDLLIARTGNTVGKSYIHESERVMVYAGYLIKFVVDLKKSLPKYVFWFTKSNQFKAWIESTARVGAQPNVNASEYSSMLLPVPPLEEQKIIVKALDGLNSQTLIAQKKMAVLLSLKKALMQDLLTGKVRVNITDKESAAS